jgi:hypothetical protein
MEDQDIEKGDAAAADDVPDEKAVAVDASMKSIDEDQLFIEVPTPGFQLGSVSNTSTPPIAGQLKPKRLVPNVCSICLCNYYPGNSIVWSSNEACDHVFHEHCILQWIMKQREGPLCPCCRRDFVLDPYDVEDEEVDPAALELEDDSDEEQGGGTAVHGGGDDDHDNSSSSSDRLMMPRVDAVAAAQEAALAFHMEEHNMGEGLSSSSREEPESAVRIED